MKTAVALAAVAAIFPLAQSINLNHKRDAAPRVWGFDVEKRTGVNPNRASRRRFRKRGTLTASLTNEDTFYFANISLGTPAQSMAVSIDTGSSDLWVNVANSTLCEKDDCEGDTFSPSKSSTLTYVNDLFNLTYADGTGAAGSYVKDTLKLGGKTVTDFQFGLGLDSTTEIGVFGVGYSGDEAIVSDAGESTYNNLPLALTNAGVINTPAYSLWLNDLDATTGSILFGGVDTDKYQGELESVPVLQTDGGYTAFYIALTKVTWAKSSTSSSTSSTTELPAAVVLDAGSTITYLPDDIVGDIYDTFGAEYDEEEGVALMDCSDADTGGYINFTFSSPTIKVKISEMLIDDLETSSGYGNSGGSSTASTCVLGLAPSSVAGVSILGDSFLRSAYVVYDLDNNEISLANTDFNATSSNVVEITAGTSGVPSASIVADAVSTVSAGSATGVLGGASGAATETGAITITMSAGGSTATSSSSGSSPSSATISLPEPLGGQLSFTYVAVLAALITIAVL